MLQRKIEILEIYLAPSHWMWQKLPIEILYLVFNLAGLVRVGKTMSYFYVHCPRLIKTRKHNK